MKLTHLRASNYRSLHDVEMDVDAVNLLIGANASGKSNVMDALAFLSRGVREEDFEPALKDRGGIVHLAWKGESAVDVRLEAHFEEDGVATVWSVRIRRLSYGGAKSVERVEQTKQNKMTVLLEAEDGKVWWRTNQTKTGKLQSKHTSSTVCALAAARVDESFPARSVAEFVARWGFFDPSPRGLRRAAFTDDDGELWTSGGNLAARLKAIKEADVAKFDRILKATQRILGVPETIEFRESEDGKVYFLQRESGLNFPVHQVGASSGTLRILALMTALYGEADATLVGLEEPENYVHPQALKAFAEYLRDAAQHAQLVIATHSPLLLDCLASPGEVVVVRRTLDGTKVERVSDPTAVNKALEESGFGLGEFFEAQGFGS